jgi:large repetitive protein
MPGRKWRIWRWCLGAIVFQIILFGTFLGIKLAKSKEARPPRDPNPGYRSIANEKGPWIIHVVRVPRDMGFEVKTVHAGQRSFGLAPLTEQLKSLSSGSDKVIAALNGDYYVREGNYAGDPRGLQIVHGEMISRPAGTASFWVDGSGQLQAGLTTAAFEVRWPDGKVSPVGLNESRVQDALVLYTPNAGQKTFTRGGRDLVLERASGETEWLPLRPGRTYRARIKEVKEAGKTPIEVERMVLSVGPAAAKNLGKMEVGAELNITTRTQPELNGATAAVSGGPLLVHSSKAQRIKVSDTDSYESSSMLERHPRSAIGWNEDYLFLVTVDGRHKGVSEGMTLVEFGAYLVELGCTEAINLDGGGSSTLWFEGEVRNRPCDGYEREIANAIVVMKKEATALGAKAEL